MTTEKTHNEQLQTADVLWNLNDLYPNTEDETITADIDWCTREGKAITRDYKGKIADQSAEQINDLVGRLETLEARLGKMLTFAFLNYTTQVDNAPAGAFYQKIHELVSQVEKDLVFFELEWNLLPAEHVEPLLAEEVLRGYQHYLSSMRRYLPHQLSEAEEKLLIERKIVERKSWNTLFDKIFGHLRFGENGRTEEEVLTDLYNADRKVRQQAASEMTAGLKSQNHILTHIFNTLAAEKMITDRQRKHTSWVSSMNLDNQLEDRTVETLISAVTSRYDIVQRFYKVKKTLLGLDTLYDYDRYAPLPALPSKLIDWEESKKMVLESFAGFSPRMAEIGSRFFDKHYIHAPVQKGKRGGAFAHPCVPEVHPYVMVNYNGNLRDVSTVAHELGHGIHQVLAAEKGYFYSDTPLVLAETASVFAELLVFRSQLELLDNGDERRAFICQKLESIFATVFRQTAMNRFEKAMHEGRREKGELSSEQLSSFWIDTQRQMFDDSITLTDDYSIWWSYIPHFLSTPGYVYSYAFGELLVLALYGIYEQEGSPFIEKYLTLLRAGGSDTPYNLLKPFAIDLDDISFWNRGLDVIDSMLKSVE
jgi:oligoendopeptidase F